MKKLGTFILVHSIVYLLGSFIAWDLNPLNWWLFTSWVGRVLFVIFELGCIFNILLED